LKIHILQRNVATQLRCDEIFNSHDIANFTWRVLVKELLKLVNI